MAVQGLEEFRYHGLLSPGSCTYYHICGIGRKVEVPPHYSDIHDDGASADLVLEEALERFVDFNNVHEYCTLAVSALVAKNSGNAIIHLEKALRVMNKYKRREVLPCKVSSRD
ncbi:hypothetical protein T4D_3886 [Trichinella pseudospiralis]|uniref:Uncharacterized protein n=1 Tax=Trichinella pseudospiralis TaxID=6337 RepID=A0A0V1FWB4_TRIPS|nr:hypothetical protein T4D_3886 [Trichinella pseudospiralis]